MKKILLSALLLATIGCSKITTGHECPFKLCPFKGMQTFATDCEDGSDCYYLDMIHFEHPTWTYDQCEDYLFKPMLNK